LGSRSVASKSSLQHGAKTTARLTFAFGLASLALVISSLICLLVALSYSASPFTEWIEALFFWLSVLFALLSVITVVLSVLHLIEFFVRNFRGRQIPWLFGSSATYALWLSILWFVYLISGEL
jgi:hypothetical protein